MQGKRFIAPQDWYETIPQSHGITLIHEPWIKPFYRCNMWFVQGRDRDLLFDSGLGAVPLRQYVALLRERPILCVASHTHFDHIGSHHEFCDCGVHALEASILERPSPHTTLADLYANDDMFDGRPLGWDPERYRTPGVVPTHILQHGDIIDLGDRAFEVIHTPGHSPGGIALWESATGVLLSGDTIYDGPLLDDTYHSSPADYRVSLETLRSLPVSIVHGGHFPSFGRVRFGQLITDYCKGRRKPGCPTEGL
ncbi:Zn-dependent hydrolase [Acetobacter estunensis NRIC 0472]|uniref:MBL fold metallo-hydrolase n=1 Tax=Acetobacter estunensis TaxID=104097 RepID=A0A967B6T2_9PROT|nr:MBL fold metallo-hydrolase [Acetobacter estunensis]NHO54912.1 MBL fold metallo-hydrolase [Acetobacter estunensis]GBQ23986.1 Zn-dependent hydrolase [Acetobacter estunensis NRIC 0472]